MNMEKEYKIIRDSIHGNIRFDDVFLSLLDALELQRLYNVKQLGLAHLVFPGAHHTRLEHSFGAFYIASEIVELLPLDVDEKKVVRCAALLHDIGHGPFSHTLESILRESMDVDHVDLTEKLIKGEYRIFHEDEESFVYPEKTVPAVLERNGIDTQLVADIIKGHVSDHPYLGQILNSVIDVDQLDYLLRDAYYTGVSYGLVDIERFLQTLLINGNTLAMNRKGVGVVENILMARALMYSSVYFHKTVRIAELMLSKAIEKTNHLHPFDFFKMTDAELVSWLKDQGVFQHEMVTRLKYRQLFKQAYHLSPNMISNAQKDQVKKLEDVSYRRSQEKMLEETLHIPEGHIIIDVPSQDIHQAEPRILETDFPIIDNDETKLLHDYTPVADAIRMRSIPEWDLMIATDACYRKIVEAQAARLLFE